MRMDEHFIQVGEVRIHYIHGGVLRDEGSVPIVLIHGISGATSWWRKNLDGLSDSCEVYALDLPGFGRSQASARPFCIEKEVAALADWLSAVQVHRALLVGHSLGGYLAALLTARSPELAAGLVLVDPAIFPPGYSYWRLVAGLIKGLFHLSLDFVPTLLRGAIEAGPDTIIKAARDLLAYPIVKELSAIRTRTLLIWGERDTVVPVTLSRFISEATSKDLVGPILLRGGHVSMWDDPDRFNETVRSFWAEIREPI